MKAYLGIDIGTFESKGVLVDGAGTIIAQASRPHKMHVPQAGWAEHDAEADWWGDFIWLTRELLRQSGIAASDIRAVACSAIGPCMLPVDHAGNPLRNAILYGVDTRAQQEIDDLNAEIGPDRILAECGNALTSQSIGPKILWFKRNQADLFLKTRKIVTSTTFLVHRLTGQYAIDRYTAANFSPIYTNSRASWTEDLTSNIVGPDKLPEILWTSAIAGHVTARAAEETGLAAGTPVLTGTIDAAAEALSVGVTVPGDTMVMYGSTIFIIQITASRLNDNRLWTAPWLFPGQNAAMSGLATSGTLTHWLRDTLAQDLPIDTAFAQLALEAEQSPPGANGLITLPYFSGERTPIHDPHAKGVVFGLNLTHSRGDIYRSALEGIGFATNHIFETYADASSLPTQLFAVGGGTKNRVWLQATSDISGQPQTLRKISTGAAYGDAFLAALALGDVTLDDINTWNPIVENIAPNSKTAALYQRRFDLFKALYTQTKGLMAALSSA